MVKKATLKAFDAPTYTADVQLAGSPVVLDGIPVSRAIPAVEMVAGRTVALLLLDPTNPADMVVVAVH